MLRFKEYKMPNFHLILISITAGSWSVLKIITFKSLTLFLVMGQAVSLNLKIDYQKLKSSQVQFRVLSFGIMPTTLLVFSCLIKMESCFQSHQGKIIKTMQKWSNCLKMVKELLDLNQEHANRDQRAITTFNLSQVI